MGKVERKTGRKKLSLRAAIAGFAALPVLCAAQIPDPDPRPDLHDGDGISMMALDSQSGTAILSATPPQFDHHGNAGFTVDISKIGLFRKIAYAGSDFTALVFNGSTNHRQRLCPFFNLNSRDYTIEEIRPYIFQVRTTLSQAEIRQVEESGCAVTTMPDRNKIKNLPSEYKGP